MIFNLQLKGAFAYLILLINQGGTPSFRPKLNTNIDSWLNYNLYSLKKALYWRYKNGSAYK